MISFSQFGAARVAKPMTSTMQASFLVLSCPRRRRLSPRALAAAWLTPARTQRGAFQRARREEGRGRAVLVVALQFDRPARLVAATVLPRDWAERLRQIRRDFAWTQAELAARLGVGAGRIATWERAKCAPARQRWPRILALEEAGAEAAGRDVAEPADPQASPQRVRALARLAATLEDQENAPPPRGTDRRAADRAARSEWSRRLRRLRLALGLSRPELAARLGVPAGTLPGWELAQCAPNAANAARIADRLARLERAASWARRADRGVGTA
jgi:transcriptional regulator with XRE-family HTH domain